ncbi:hypothetical protein QBC35DRAFT_279961 [Podospora australis]|uniref:Uncharacterized protein n=1 Tax=Podospora australis TaxID=1536484 RepID=A0AAN7AM80_9PEZI|nr:hypothetical protein QBC35DRAFT_279961 [Podospora australis]
MRRAPGGGVELETGEDRQNDALMCGITANCSKAPVEAVYTFETHHSGGQSNTFRVHMTQGRVGVVLHTASGLFSLLEPLSLYLPRQLYLRRSPRALAPLENSCRCRTVCLCHENPQLPWRLFSRLGDCWCGHASTCRSSGTTSGSPASKGPPTCSIGYDRAHLSRRPLHAGWHIRYVHECVVLRDGRLIRTHDEAEEIPGLVLAGSRWQSMEPSASVIPVLSRKPAELPLGSW